MTHFLVEQLAVLALLAAAAWAAGSRLAARLGGEPVVALAIGLALVGQLALLLGTTGLLRPWLIVTAALVCLATARPAHRIRLTGRAVLLGCVIALPFLVVALYPPTVWDETMYHLPYARAFAATGGMPFLGDLRYPIFPQLSEALDAAVLCFGGDVATHLVGLLAAFTTAGWLHVAGGRSPAGTWAAMIYLGCPIVAYLAGTAYVEPMLGLFGAGAVLAAERWRDERRVGWLVLSGLFAGSAASTKYLGLFFVVAVGFEVLWIGARRGGWLRAIAIYGVVVAAAGGLAYGRIVHETGNPVFPFFGANDWNAEIFLGRHGLDRLWGALTLLFDVVFRRETVGWLPPYSPAIALAVPLVIWRAVRDARVRRLALYAAAYILVAPLNAHYLLGVAPLICLAIGLSLASIAWARRHAIMVAVALLLPGWSYGGFLCWQRGSLPIDDGSREAYLARTFPLYPAIAALGRAHPGETIYGYHAEDMVVFASGRWLGDFNGPARYARIEGAPPAVIASELRAMGVRYLLVPWRTHLVSFADPAWWRDFALDHADEAALVLRVRSRLP